jgi:H+/Cl- antiporter ClcA
MTAGAVFGRLFENVVGMIVFTSNPGIYAAVGAASLVSATTHTISVTVIVFEITGQIHYFLPMIVSVLVSYSVSNFFSMSIYDALLEIKGLPYLP